MSQHFSAVVEKSLSSWRILPLWEWEAKVIEKVVDI